MTDSQASPAAERPGGSRHRAAPAADVPTQNRPVQAPGQQRGTTYTAAAAAAAHAELQEAAAQAIEERLTHLRARERQVERLESQVRVWEERARAAQNELRAAEVRLLEVRTVAAQQAGTPTARADRGAQATAVRDHELARIKAKFMNGETAGGDLAERLRFAHLQDGKPSLDALGTAVGYSKATLSKVFNGKMLPAWALVRKLAAELHVPGSVVMQEWRPIWVAADMHRQQNRGHATEPVGPQTSTAATFTEPTGHTCPKCGAWVVDSTTHAGWHMAMGPGDDAPDAESIEGWRHQTRELDLLREALGTDRKP